MEKSPKNYDVLIIGAGPAGANAAISYKNLNPNLTVGLVDKAIFQEINHVVMRLVPE